MLVIELASIAGKRCLPLSRCWREQRSAKTLHLSQNVLTLRSLMALLNDFAFNGRIVPTHSGTGRPRILCGRVWPNEIFNHYGDSGRTDNLKKKKKIPAEWKGWLQHLCAAVLTLDIEEDVKGFFFFFFCKSGSSCLLLWLCIKVKIKDVDCWQRHRVTAGVTRCFASACVRQAQAVAGIFQWLVQLMQKI